MSVEACREWRGDLALLACGRQDPATEAALLGHLDGCAVCRRELRGLQAVVGALDGVDADLLEDAVDAPPELPERILQRVDAERRQVRRRARRRVGAAVVAAAAILLGAVGATAAVRGDGSEPGLEVVFDDAPVGVAATAELVAKRWGTEVSLRVTGLAPDRVYWLWLTDAGGKRMGAGTFLGIDGAARVVLASALPTASASRIWLTDADNHTVLDESVHQS